LLEEVQPGFPAALANGEQPHIAPTTNSSGRRTALANWIASPGNPLTARVFVNRVWAQYFGHGIVDSVSDFGKMGDKPVNPELFGLPGRHVRAPGPLEHQEPAAAPVVVERLSAIIGRAPGRGGH